MNQTVVITGAQRSGTTLLSLILDSHPELNTIDELDFVDEALPRYLAAPKLAPRVVFKLPQRATDAHWVGGLPDARVLWCLRDPRDVVASMLDLRIPLTRMLDAAWAIHPRGAPDDIERARMHLDDEQRVALDEELARYDAIRSRPLIDMAFADAVLCASMAWRLMNEMLRGFEAAALPVHLVRYEELVTEPRPHIAAILDHLGVAWHDDVLRHHELHSGIYAARTDFARAIDRESVGRWRNRFSDLDLAIISRITRPLAERLGCWREDAPS